MKKYFPVFWISFLLPGAFAFGQPIDGTVAGSEKLSPKVIDRIGAQAAEMDRTIRQTTSVYLNEMSKRESLLQKAACPKDSNLTKQLFGEAKQKYQQLQTLLANGGSSSRGLSEYLPLVDSMHSALDFLNRPGGGTNRSPSTLQAVQKAVSQLQHLEGSWQLAREAEAFIREREQQLTTQLSGQGLAGKLLSTNKTAFYFQQQLSEYKSLLQNKDKLKEKVLSTVRNSSAFQHFMEKNSYVGRLFHLPDNYGSPASLPGLQTKDMIQQRIGLNTGSSEATGGSGNSGGDPGQFLQQKVDDGQQQIGQLKSKLRELGQSSGSGDMVMPQFTPNDQKTKTFLTRLQYGINLQTQQAYGIMPATVSLGLILGYKLSSKATVGLGGSYNIGLGQGLTHLSYSGQGAGLRSFVDVRARGSLWFTGGLEYNYVQGFSSWRDLGNWDQWQKSALFGLSKKFKLSGNKSSNILLLFDALYKQYIPASAPLVFRVGYSFN
jgi:hypothetical protein